MIDPDYTGCVHMILVNISSNDYQLEKHERIGALVFEHYAIPQAKEVMAIEQTEHDQRRIW